MAPTDPPNEVPLRSPDDYPQGIHPAPTEAGRKEGEGVPPPTEPAEEPSAVGDYTRDIQLEYEEQQEEGKL